jgi:hypothetical protein
MGERGSAGWNGETHVLTYITEYSVQENCQEDAENGIILMQRLTRRLHGERELEGSRIDMRSAERCWRS